MPAAAVGVVVADPGLIGAGDVAIDVDLSICRNNTTLLMQLIQRPTP